MKFNWLGRPAWTHNIPLVCVVCPNHLFGNMGLTQIKCYGGRSSETEVPSFNVANITRGLGVHGERVEKPEEMIPALERALGSGKLALLEEAVDASLENIVPLQVYECRIVATHDNWEIMVRTRDGVTQKRLMY